MAVVSTTGPKNHWQCFDSVEPFLVWDLSCAVVGPERVVVLAAILGLGKQDGILLAEPPPPTSHWPYEEALHAEETVPWRSRVHVRDAHGAIVVREGSDAGAMLAGLEPLEPAYRRRFAASHPFVGAWTNDADAPLLSVHLGFWANLHFDEQDAELLAKNQPALLAFRKGLLNLAQAHRGALSAPLPPPQQ